MINLAHDSDMEYIQLSRIERGQINTTIFQLYKIAQALEVDLQLLFENFENEIDLKLNFENMVNSSSKNNK
jgi:transcriptional regulator with XRE-family HTH domain